MQSGRVHALFIILVVVASAAVSFVEAASISGDVLVFQPTGTQELNRWGNWKESYTHDEKAPTITVFKRWSLYEGINSNKSLGVTRYPTQDTESETLRALANYLVVRPHAVLITDQCSGDYSSTHHIAYNGWTFDDLQSHVKSYDFALIPTFLPWKIELTLRSPTKIVCGEDQSEMARAHSLLQTFRDLVAQSKSETDIQALHQIQAHLARVISEFEVLNQQTAHHLATVIQKFRTDDTVVLAHENIVQKLTSNLQDDRVNYRVFQAKDFQEQAADFLSLLRATSRQANRL